MIEITQGEGKVRRRVLRAVPRRKAVLAVKDGSMLDFSCCCIFAISRGAGEMAVWVGMERSSVAMMGGSGDSSRDLRLCEG